MPRVSAFFAWLFLVAGGVERTTDAGMAVAASPSAAFLKKDLLVVISGIYAEKLPHYQGSPN
jgi:hypothetical protein